ncbi:MAG: hypothetical protein COW29_07985 [Rhodobacterales bacterium CG15_BIG_FIL_POST_REV_8_21_14_020_59_13]|nr:MAG: hypothetical protein COW29_07985 [Rhodobacterales bacterium CG15_BIG_FIL_POST_REV_8_21_14_020_59_13]
MRTAIAALVLLSAGAQAQTDRDIYSQRALARALDDRCSLFLENERLALEGAYLQARGDLLRAGYHASRIDQSYDQISRNAANQPCSSDATLAIAAAIRSAFAGWQRARFQNYAGAPSPWQASRPYGYDSWVIAQTLPGEDHPLQVGLYNTDSTYAFTIAANLNPQIAVMALHVRNPAIAPALNDPSLGGLLDVEGMPSWTSFLPPAEGRRSFMPELRWSDESLAYFRFSEEALAAFSALDPREAALIEAFDAQGHLITAQYVGIGDFAAALAFVRSSPVLSAGR